MTKNNRYCHSATCRNNSGAVDDGSWKQLWGAPFVKLEGEDLNTALHQLNHPKDWKPKNLRCFVDKERTGRNVPYFSHAQLKEDSM